MLHAQDLATYTAAQVATLTDVDAYAVRAEGERRQNAALRKLARAKRMLAAGQRELEDAGRILQRAFDAIAADHRFADWQDAACSMLGHDLDGDVLRDGYSMEEARRHYDNGAQPHAYAAHVMRRPVWRAAN